MDYKEFKEKHPIGTVFKCLEIPPLSIEDNLWNGMAKQQLNFEVVGHVVQTKLNKQDQYTIIIKVVSYDPMTCTLSKSYLEDTHFFHVNKVRVGYLQILNKSESFSSASNQYPHVCPKCGAPAYVGLFSSDCSRKCN